MKLSQTNGPILHFYNGDERASLEHLKNAGFKYVDISFWSRYTPGSRYFTTDNEVLADEYKRYLDELDQYAELKKLGSRLEGMHIHDNYGRKRAKYCDFHQPPFYGNVNFDAVIQALLEIDYKGTFNFEVDCPVNRDVMPFVNDGEEQTRLTKMSAALRLESEGFLYQIGKQMLEAYECYEE